MKRHLSIKKIVTWGLLTLFLTSATTLSTAGKFRKGYLGVSVERLSRDDRKDLDVSHGVLVTHVEERGPAEKADIQEDDIIQYFNDEKIRKPDDLVQAVRQTKPKTEVKVTLNRDGKQMDINVVVGKLRSPYVYRYGGDGNIITLMRGGGAYLGVQLQALNKDLAGYFGVEEDGGALILEVEEESPADEAGMKSGDVIVVVDEEEVEDPQDVRNILSDFEEGDEVDITVVRQKRKQKLTVELDEHANRSSINIMKGLIDRKNFNRGLQMHIHSPGIYRLDAPDIDFDIEDLDEDIEERLLEKLEGLQFKIGDRMKEVEKKLNRIKECYWFYKI